MSRANRDPIIGFTCDSDVPTRKGEAFNVRVAAIRLGYDHRPYVDYASTVHMASPEALAEWARALFKPQPEEEE